MHHMNSDGCLSDPHIMHSDQSPCVVKPRYAIQSNLLGAKGHGLGALVDMVLKVRL
jgi:hypothetical protein